MNKLLMEENDRWQISQEVSQPSVTGWGRRPAALRSLSQRLSKGFNEAVNGFTDDGWSMLESDGIDDVTLLVNSSPSKMMGINIGYNNSGFPSVTSSVLCAKASMLLQNVPPAILLRFLREHRSEWADTSIDAYSAAAIKAGPCSLPETRPGSFGGQVIPPLAITSIPLVIFNLPPNPHHSQFLQFLLHRQPSPSSSLHPTLPPSANNTTPL
ncbi:hypothetical protein RYX36_033241 [Vicia faba]